MSERASDSRVSGSGTGATPGSGATAAPEIPRRGRRVVAAARWLGAALALLAAACVVVWVGRAQWLAPWIERRLAAEVERTTGARIDIAELRGSWLTELVVRSASWRDDRPRAVLSELDVGEARARYSLWKLLRGDPAWLRSVRAEGVRIVLRTDQPVPPEPQPPGPPLRLHLPPLQLQGVDLTLLMDGGRLVVAGAQASLDPPDEENGGAQRLLARAGDLRLERAGLPELSGAPEIEGAWKGTRIDVYRATFDGEERFSRSWVDLERVLAGGVEWAVNLRALGGRLSGEGRWDRGTLEHTYWGEGVDLAGLLAALFPPLGLRLEGVVHGRGALHLRARHPEERSVAFDGRVESARVGERAFDELSFDAEWRSSEVVARQLLARRQRDVLQASDLLIPLIRDPYDMLRAARGRVSLESYDVPAWIAGLGAPAVRKPPSHRFEVALRLAEYGLLVDRGELATAGGRFDVRPSSIAWPAPGADLSEALLDVACDMDFRDLRELSSVLALDPPWSGSARGELRLSGPALHPSGRFDVEGRDVALAGLPLGDLRVLARLDARRLDVERLRAEGALGVLSGSGTWSIPERVLSDVDVHVSSEHLERLWPARFRRGALNADLRVSGDWRDPRGTYDLRLGDVELTQRPGLTLDALSVQGSLQDGLARLDAFSLELERVRAFGRGALAHARGAPPYALDLSELSLERDGIELASHAPLRARFDGEEFDVSGVDLRGGLGRFQLEAQRRGGQFSLDALGGDLDPMPFLAPFVPSGFELAGFAGELHVAHDASGWGGRAAFEIARLRPGAGQPDLSVTARGELAERSLRLEALRLDGADFGDLTLSGYAPLDATAANLDDRLADGPLALRGDFHLRDIGELSFTRGLGAGTLAGACAGSVDLSGTWDALRGTFGLKAEDLTLRSQRMVGVELLGPAQVEVQGRLDDGIAIDTLRLSSPGQIELGASVRLQSALDLRPLIHGDASGLLDAELSGTADVAVPDVSFLARTLGLRRLSGALDASLSLSGSARHAEPRGWVQWRDGELRVDGDSPNVSGVQALINVDGTRIELASARAELGGGPVGMNGVLELGQSPRVDLELNGRDALLVQRNDLRVRADASLALTGPLEALALTGSVDVRDGRYTRDVDFFGGAREVSIDPAQVDLPSLGVGPLARTRLDVAIVSSEPFRIENNIARGSVNIELTLGGTAHAPQLTGALFVEPTRVALPASVLRTTSGTLTFEPRRALDPELDVHLETRVRGYDVAVNLRGTAAAPEVELSSVPPLPSESVLMLLLTGKPPELAWDKDTGGAAAQTVAVYVGKDVLSRWFSSEDMGDESWLDRIEWRTGADVSQTGKQTSELSIRILGSAMGTGRAVWLRAENDAYDRSNLGVRFVLRSR